MEMILTDKQKNKIMQIVNVFETGTIQGDYSKVSLFEDGPNNIKQITYGRSQTTEFGLLDDLLKKYIKNDGLYAKEMLAYLELMTKYQALGKSLHENKDFIKLLKLAGKDPIMVKTQDEFFEEAYFTPALRWATRNGFTEPLSMAVIYDSFIHSGGILSFLRNRFKEYPPIYGGDEKIWIKQYVSVRDSWLRKHSRKILNKTVYRTKAFQDAIENNNWDLSKPFNANGTSILKNEI